MRTSLFSAITGTTALFGASNTHRGRRRRGVEQAPEVEADLREHVIVGKCAIVVRIGAISTLSHTQNHGVEQAPEVEADLREHVMVGKCAIVVRIGAISTLSHTQNHGVEQAPQVEADLRGPWRTAVSQRLHRRAAPASRQRRWPCNCH
jgi:hypothetical protein